MVFIDLPIFKIALKYLKIIRWALWLTNLYFTFNSLNKAYEQTRVYVEQIKLYVV